MATTQTPAQQQRRERAGRFLERTALIALIAAASFYIVDQLEPADETSAEETCRCICIWEGPAEMVDSAPDGAE